MVNKPSVSASQSLRQHQQVLRLPPRPKGLWSVTRDVRQVVQQSDIQLGLCTLFLRHTSASLLIQENADPDVL